MLSFKNAKGLGDVVAVAIKLVTGKEPDEDCGCSERKERLNKWFPFRRKQDDKESSV